MSKTLYRTYRPKNFSDVLGQDHIVHTLQNALTSGRVSHAYLFTGPRGTGKTTIARLFATAVNVTPRKNFTPVDKDVAQRLQDGTSLDIIEIDAASSTSVEGIRALKETIGVTPTEARYKVYIIDEVHMLSTSAFNALLKTLEEPPAHVIFILATTEIHKVPETILSRCQRFDFARFSISDIMTKLRTIAKAEKVKIDDDALEMIAITANGGMRDAESLLAQVFALEDKNVTAAEVATILGTTTSQDVIDMIRALVLHDTEQALTIIDNTQKNGYNLETFIRSLIEKLRVTLFLSLHTDMGTDIQQLVALPKTDITTLAEIASKTHARSIIMIIEECTTALQKTKNTTIPQLPLEIAAVNICLFDKNAPKTPTTPVATQKQEQIPETSAPEKHSPTIAKQSTEASTEVSTETPIALSTEMSDQWRAYIALIEEIHRPIAQILADCTLCAITDTSITITTDRAFYQERIMQNNHRTIIESAACDYFKKPMRITVTVEKKADQSSSEILAYAKQLMGGAITG
ncbi:MAG: DNA polymerase III subunit gamma/tau [Parcubacteria group bacterium]|jgi:DNA polymerase-3 subunit gamma/tau